MAKLADDLVKRAALGDDEELDESDEADKPMDLEGDHKSAFMRMAAAIRDGDDDAAWSAYQDCRQYDAE